MLSNGEKHEGPKALKRLLPRLRQRCKAVLKLSRLHYRIACVRNDYLHKLTTDLVRRFTLIGIEDLNVKGMMSNRKLARHIVDQGFWEFRRQLEYKAETTGVEITVADRFFPSSKRCRTCGNVNKELKLSERTWACSCCLSSHDRDGNTAGNLEDLAAGLAVTACGVG